MLPLKTIAGFVGRFALLFAIFVAPWPGLDRVEAACIQSIATQVFGGTHGNREVSFEEIPGQPGRTRAVIVNRALLNSDGSGPVRNLDLDLDRLVIRPLAVLLALILVTPVPWRRRVRSIVVSLVVLFVCLFALFGFCLWLESAELMLVNLGQVSKTLASDFRSASIAQAVIALPVLIWLVVTIRRDDISRFFPSGPQPAGEEI